MMLPNCGLGMMVGRGVGVGVVVVLLRRTIGRNTV